VGEAGVGKTKFNTDFSTDALKPSTPDLVVLNTSGSVPFQSGQVACRGCDPGRQDIERKKKKN